MGGEDIRILDDPDVLRIVADPLRLRLLEALRRAPMTVTELAEELGVARTRLYYHVRLLEGAGLVTVAETNVVSGIPEKRYRVTAYRLTIDRALLTGAGGDRQPLDVLLSVIFDEVASEIRRSVTSGLIDLDDGGGSNIAPRRMAIGRNWYRLSDREVGDFAAAVDRLWRAMADRQVELTGGQQGVGWDEELRSVEQDAATDDPGEPRRLYEWVAGFYPIVPPEPAGSAGTEDPTS
ncbi:MAG TPA: helix-turn-helix domain-containing protein [Thermomicrobiales bacterium]|jgi:DNA-binding transcriptional ArsR family regulator|nr:helix-turn-helix domain-containing protein [Thermomicrobiales bacterium]